jgi:hypothetical protein
MPANATYKVVNKIERKLLPLMHIGVVRKTLVHAGVNAKRAKLLPLMACWYD